MLSSRSSVDGQQRDRRSGSRSAFNGFSHIDTDGNSLFGDVIPSIQSDIMNGGYIAEAHEEDQSSLVLGQDDIPASADPTPKSSVKAAKTKDVKNVSIVRLDPTDEGQEDDEEEESNTSVAATPAVARKRGRPSKAESTPRGTNKTATPSSKPVGVQGKRKRGDQDNGTRKSARVAADVASQQISERSAKRAKTAVAQAKPTAGRGRPKTKVDAKPTAGRGRPKANVDAKPTAGRGRPKTKVDAKPAAVKKGTRGRKPAAKAEIEVAPEWEVESILDRRHFQEAPTLYLVKWKGFTNKDNTWEPVSNLTHCSQLLKKFRAEADSKQTK